jgi:NitT/TauT family transport system substrate-binding protein
MKKISYLFSIILFLLLMAACSPAEPQELTTVRINRTTNISYAPIFLADAEGYFEEYGIQLEMIDFNRTAEAIPLVIAGELDVYAGTTNAGLLNTLYLEPNLRVVADRGSISPDMPCVFQGILIRKDLIENGTVTGPKDLKGMKIASSTAGPGAFVLSSYLAQGGLTFADVQISDLPNSSYIDAMRNDSIDAIVAVEITLSRVLAAGDSVLLIGDKDIMGNFQTSILAFGKNLLVDDPDLGVRFLAAYLKGIAKYNEGKTEENLRILTEAMAEDLDVLKNSCWVPIRLDGAPDFDSLNDFMRWSLEQDHLDHLLTEDKFWDPKFLSAAKSLIESGN